MFTNFWGPINFATAKDFHCGYHSVLKATVVIVATIDRTTWNPKKQYFWQIESLFFMFVRCNSNARD